MMIIHHATYRRTCRIVVNLRFSRSNFDVLFLRSKLQNTIYRCVCIKRRAILKLSESFEPKEQGIKKI